MADRTCSVEECCGPAIKRGWCRKHYERWRIHGDPLAFKRTIAPEVCTISGCGRPHQARGWCTLHYDRWRTHGDPLELKGSHGDPAGRFWAYVPDRPDDGCWLWTGHTNGSYGVFWDGERHRLTHRFAYELVLGPIPEGLVLDHLCRTPRCVRPDHLEPVTQQENVRRAFAV